MQHDKNLTAEIEKKLPEYNIKKEDILYAALTDLTLDGELAQGCLLLCGDALIHLTAEPVEGEVFEFKGTGKRRETSRLQRQWREERWNLQDIRKLSVLRTVSGGILVAEEPDRPVAAFTNLHMGQIMQLTKLFEKWKEKGRLTEEDYRGEEEEEYCPKCGIMYPDKNRKICPRCMSKGSLIRRILEWFKPYRLKIAIMLLLIVVCSLLSLVVPYLNGIVLYDKVLSKNEAFLAQWGIPGGQYGLALGLVVLTIAVTKLLLQVVSILRSIMMDEIVVKIIRDVKAKIFENMAKLSISFYTSRQTGGLMTRVLGDTDNLANFMMDFPWMIMNILLLVFTIPVMFILDWRLALLTVCLMPFAVVFAWKMNPVIENMYGKRHRAERAMNGKIHDNLMGSRVVKAFGREREEERTFSSYNARMRKSEIALVSYANRFYVVFNVVKYSMVALAWGAGAFFMARGGHITLSLLITFVGYVQQLHSPIDMLSYSTRVLAEFKNNTQRILEVIDSVPEVTEKEKAKALENFRGEVELDGVTFGYEPNKPILKNVTLRVKSGEVLGIVGRSGAGKTTLVNLISRLYDPQEGTVRLDGVDVRDLSFDSLRGEVAMVSQETYIFRGTVRANIAYARPTATAEEVLQAARLASAHDFICAMPDGYDTMIGSGGRELSGGERQRISIARAILANPRILILDEATAAVDTETEQAITKSLNYLVKGRTTISIAHRLSTLKDADRLIVLEEGKITEEGTHEELIKQKGTYYKLKELQTKALAMRGIE